MVDSQYDNNNIYIIIFLVVLVIFIIIIIAIAVSNNNNNDGNSGGGGGCNVAAAAKVKDSNEQKESKIHDKLDKIIQTQVVIMDNIYDSENDSSIDSGNNFSEKSRRRNRHRSNSDASDISMISDSSSREMKNFSSMAQSPISSTRSPISSTQSPISSTQSPISSTQSPSTASLPSSMSSMKASHQMQSFGSSQSQNSSVISDFSSSPKRKEKKVRFSEPFVDIDGVSSSSGPSLFGRDDGKHKYTVAYESGTNTMEPSNINQFTSDLTEHAQVKIGGVTVKVTKNNHKNEQRVIEISDEQTDDEIIDSMNNPENQNEQIKDATMYQPDAITSNFSSPENKTILRPKASNIPKPKSLNVGK